MVQKDISASFMSEAKWQSVLSDLTVASCPWTSIRLFHNTGQHLQELLDALHSNSSVERLFIGNVDPEGASALAKFLGCTSSVRVLEVQNAKDAETLFCLNVGLSSNSSIEELLLSGVDTCATMSDLASSLAARPQQLSLLSMTRCKGVTDVCTAAVRGGRLRSLSLSSCGLRDQALCPFLQQSLASDSARYALLSLQTLDLSNNQLGAASLTALHALLSSGCVLTQLVLSNNRGLGKYPATTTLADCLESGTSLQHVDLSECGISAQVCRAISAALRQNSSLQELSLDGNSVGVDGLASLLEGLTQQGGSQLRSLSLKHNGIRSRDFPPTDDVASVRVQEEKGCSALQVLDLSHNPISDNGLEFVLRTLAHASSLEQMLLKDCCISDQGVAHLLPFIMVKPSLSALNLDHNRVRNSGGTMLLQSLPSHRGLTYFTIEDNCRISDPSLRQSLTDLAQSISGRQVPPSSSPSPVAPYSAVQLASSLTEGAVAAVARIQRHAASSKRQLMSSDGMKEGAASDVGIQSSPFGVLLAASKFSVYALNQHTPMDIDVEVLRDSLMECTSLGSDTSCISAFQHSPPNAHTGLTPANPSMGLALAPPHSAGQFSVDVASLATKATTGGANAAQATPVRPNERGSMEYCSHSGVLKRRMYRPLTAEQQQLFVDF